MSMGLYITEQESLKDMAHALDESLVRFKM